jgi:hypothetical protein
VWGKDEPHLRFFGRPEGRQAHAPVGINPAFMATYEQRTLRRIERSLALICGFPVHA